MNGPEAVGSPGVRTYLARHLWLQASLVLLVCAAVYWPALGHGGMAMSEAHRVVPAHEMLDSGDWLTPTMFGAAYARKPPGMSWAIAACSMAFGQTEWAARAVSALSMTLMALGAWRVGTRWFGSPWGLASGLAVALMPQMWESGRSAEIEALNNLGTLVCALAVLEIVLARNDGRVRTRVALGVVLALGVVVMGLAKGPAGAPVLGGALLAGAALRLRGLARVELWGGLALGALVVAGAYYAVWRSVDASGLDSPVALHGTHLWRPGHVLGVLTLAPTAWVWALPASLALLFAWGPDARREAEGDEDARARRTYAMGATLAWVFALGIYTLLGISNARYAAPAGGLAAVAAAYAVRGAACGSVFTDRRRGIARAMLLGRAWVWVVLLLVGAWVYISTREGDVRATSGRGAGVRLAGVIADAVGEGRVRTPTTLVADDAIEARPEVLASARRELGRLGLGRDVRVVWNVGRWANWNPEYGDLVLLRLDAGSEESQLVEGPGARAGLVELGRFDVHKYKLGLYLSEPNGESPPGG